MEEILTHYNIDDIMRLKKGISYSGGGMLGMGHAGVINKLKELYLYDNIRFVSGTSVGSIMAVATAAKASREYIKDTAFGMDTKSFKDGGCFLAQFIRLITKGGLHSGKGILKFARQMLFDLTGSKNTTMKELFDMHGIHLTIVVFSLRYRSHRNIDHITQPDAKVAEMIRASSGISLFFAPIKVKLLSVPDKYGNRRLELDNLADGGVTHNAPVTVLRNLGLKSHEILNVIFVGNKDKKEYQENLEGRLHDHGLPKIPVGLIEAHIDGLRTEAMRQHIHKDDWKLTIKIDTGDLGIKEFDMSNENKRWLYESGEIAVTNHIKDARILLEKNKYPL